MSENSNNKTSHKKVEFPENKNKKPSNSKISNNKKQEEEIRIGKYIIKKTLGKGTFAKVKLAFNLSNNEIVAIKIIEKNILKEEDDIIRLKREFDMLSKFNHPNVISVSEIFENRKAYFTVMEYCDGGELFNYIVENRILSEEKAAFFYYQLINGLEYIHSLGIVHRDLKPENLLLTKDLVLKISDFGLSNYFDKNENKLLETPCGSPCYASPEMLSGNDYDGFKIDIWATGIILFAMLCGYLPFDHKDNDILFKKILDCKIKYPSILGKEAKDLIKKILVPEPEKRITIPEIKMHPFYLKGKEIFDSAFIVYQEEQNDISDFSEEIYYKDSSNSRGRKNFFSKLKIKSEKLLLNFSYFFEKDLYINYRKSKSFEKIEYEFNIKKFICGKKEKLKLKADKNNNYEKFKNEKIYSKNGGEEDIPFLTYYNSTNYLIKDINEFCEKMINQYKIFQKNKAKKNKKNNININNINKNLDISLIRNDISVHENKSKDEKKLNKNNNKNLKKYQLTEVLENQINDNFNASLNNRIALQKNNMKKNKKLINKNIKVNKKIIPPFKLMVSELLIKNKNKLKTNIIPQKNKLKSFDLIEKTTDLSEPKIIKLKNIFNIINQQTIKPNINIINKQNIIHHFITKITNISKKNYYSNKISNGYDKDNKNNLNLHKKGKILNNLIENKNSKTINNDYLKNIHSNNKNKLLKLKVDIKKKLKNNKIIYKNINKQNKNNKNFINKTNHLTHDENKNYGNLTIREKLLTERRNNMRLKISTNSLAINQNMHKIINSKIKRFNLNNNINHLNKNRKNKFSKSKNDLTLEKTLRHKNINTTISSETTNKYLNSFININNSLQKTQGDFYDKKNKEKLNKTKLNINLNKIDNLTIDNDIFNLTERRFNANLNIKKLKNLKKSNLSKQQSNKKNIQKLNLKYIFGINNKSKIDNTLPINYRQNLQTQRNKPSKFTISQNNKNIFNYQNTTTQNKNIKILNILDINNLGHIKSKEIFSTYTKNNNKYYIRNNINKTSDNININNETKKKKLLHKYPYIENLHNTYITIFDRNDNTYIKNINDSNYNNIDNKFIDSSRIIRKKINLNGNIFNNNDFHIPDNNKNKINKKITLNNITNNKKANNKYNILNEYIEDKKFIKIDDYTDLKDINNINNIKPNNQKLLIETKKSNENNKINNKFVNIQNLKKNLNLFDFKNHHYNAFKTEVNFKNSKENNYKFNPFENKNKISNSKKYF